MEDVQRAADDVADVVDDAVQGVQDGLQRFNENFSVNDVVESVSEGASEGASEAVSEVSVKVSEAVTELGLPDWSSVVNDTAPFALDASNSWIFVTLFLVTLVVGLLLNILFGVSSLCTRRSRNTGHYLMLNLSLRDLLFLALCAPFAMDEAVISYGWNFGQVYCCLYRYFYFSFLLFLPLTLVFLVWHLFMENCKWSLAGEEGVVPRPWTHTVYIPLIWILSMAFGVPALFFSEVRDVEDDFYANTIENRPQDAKVCMHRGGKYETGSLFFLVESTLLTFALPLVLLALPWKALFLQTSACCTRKLRSTDFWLSLISILVVFFFVASRLPYEAYNVLVFLRDWPITKLDLSDTFLGFVTQSELYRILMKWAIFAPSLLHPLVMLLLAPDVRHGVAILFTRLCSCCCGKNGDSSNNADLDAEGADVEHIGDDEREKMLKSNHNTPVVGNNSDMPVENNAEPVPLQSKQEDEM